MVDNTFLTFAKIKMDPETMKEEISVPDDEPEQFIYFFETLEDFECCGDEVLVESSPPASPDMAARLAQPHQGGGGGGGAGGTSPSGVRELIVIPELPNSIHLQHAIQQDVNISLSNLQVSSTVVEVNGDSSGHSSPTTEAQHTYITVASEGGNGVNYHVQYVESQDIYSQAHQGHMDPLRSYPVYVGNAASSTEGTSADSGWGGASSAEYTTYGVVVAGDEAETPASPATPAAGTAQPPRMPPATVQWLLDNYETAEGVSLPRSTLYSHYLRHCASHRLDPVNAASFGKLIRSVFIGLRTRRLGTRGNSKYHYYGIRAKASSGEISPPSHDGLDDKTDSNDPQECSGEREEGAGVEGGAGGVGGAGGALHRQYLGAVCAPDPPALEPTDLPPDVPRAALQAFRRHHRQHGVELLEAAAALDTGGVERARRSFWRRPPPDLCRKTMLRLAACPRVAAWLRAADLQLYQRVVELLLPDVLRPIPPHLTQSIRNFAKSLESALSAGGGGVPAASARAQSAAGGALSAALRRYTSLNHLAQAARAVLTNHHQIQQMLADLNRVDFRVVREQAAWACSCAAAGTAHRLEADFKATLGRGATLEQWAAWLESCVRAALAPHEKKPDYTARARRLLLDWSFYSSLVIRELTLRSAASFGSFHLIRLLYDEYVSYLIERRVAAHTHAPPIGVMHRQEEEQPEDSSLPLEENSRESEPDPDDPDWEWADDDEEDDEPVDNKKPRVDYTHTDEKSTT